MVFSAISDAQNINLMAPIYTGSSYKGIGIGNTSIISSSRMDDSIPENINFLLLKRRSQNRGGCGVITSLVQRVSPVVFKMYKKYLVNNVVDDNDSNNQYNE